nr:MAG TPA: hypothetical protein [Caudoviricetes sp.]
MKSLSISNSVRFEGEESSIGRGIDRRVVGQK